MSKAKTNTQKQTNAKCSQKPHKSIKKFNGQLPPILPKLQFPKEIRSGLGTEARRRIELVNRAYSTAVYAHKDQSSLRRETLISEPTTKLFIREKEQLLRLFDAECITVLNSVRGLLERQKPISSERRIALLEDYQSWMKQLKELLKEAIFAKEPESQANKLESFFKKYPNPDNPTTRQHFRHLVMKPVFSEYEYFFKFNDLFNAQMELEQQLGLMTTILLDWIATIEKRTNKPQGNGGEDEIKKRFTFNESQALFDNEDLDLPTGDTISILKKLVESAGVTVKHQDLDSNSNPSNASEILKGRISDIKKALKRHKIPVQINPKRGVGYVLQLKKKSSR